MSDDNIITHERFGGGNKDVSTAVKKDVLQISGGDIRTHVSEEEISEMKLTEPGYGEETIGYCDSAEQIMFRELWECQKWLENEGRNILGEGLTKVGTDILDSDRNKSLEDVLAEGQIKMDFVDDERGAAYFKIQRRVAMLHALFHWTVGERLNRHHHRLGVRSKMRIVTVERRY